MDLFSIAAQHGNAKGEYNLGAAYLTGKGVGQDYAIARQWFEKSADQNMTWQPYI